MNPAIEAEVPAHQTRFPPVLAGTPRPGSTPAEEIAEDPNLLRVAGRLIYEATAGSGVRFDKIAALRQAIEAGSYKVSSDQLAERIMGSMHIAPPSAQKRITG